MEINELNIFPVPVLHVKEFLYPPEIKLAYDFIKNNNHQTTKHFLLEGNSVSSRRKFKEFDILEELSKNFKEWGDGEDCVQARLHLFLTYMSIKACIQYNRINGSWFNIQGLNSNLSNHVHNCNWVGALYIKVDKDSFPLVLENPSKHSQFTIHDLYNKNPLYEQNYKIYPTIGDLIIFPGYLFHGSGKYENLSEERIVISFNVI